MIINRKNYEQVLMDYFDGRLGPVDTACLMAFLEENPDIREEFESFEEIRLDPSGECTFHAKDGLKQHIIPEGDLITEKNYLEVFFDDAEHRLDAETKQHLDQFLHKNPSLVLEYYTWRNAHLIPDEYNFDRKSRLKKVAILPFVTVRRDYAFAGLAAVFAMLIISGLFLLNNLNTPTGQGLPLGKVQALQEFKDAGSSAISEQEVPAVNQTEWLAEQQQKEEKKGPREVQQPYLAQRNPALEKMTLRPGKPATGGVNEQPPQQLAGYITEFTGIMKMYDLRQRIRQPEPEEPQYAQQQNNNNTNTGSDRITFWDVAEYGVAGYNSIAEKDIKYKRRINSQGRTSALTLGPFAFEKK